MSLTTDDKLLDQSHYYCIEARDEVTLIGNVGAKWVLQCCDIDLTELVAAYKPLSHK